MRGLFFKIFAVFWIAQSLIFVISTALIVRQRFAGPGNFADALDSHLIHTAEGAMEAFDRGGCAAFSQDVGSFEPMGAALLDADGNLVCRTLNAPPTNGLAAHFPDHVDGRQVNGESAWLVPVTAKDGRKLEYVWFAPPGTRHKQPRRFPLLRFAFPQLPVAIAVGGVTTFLLVLLISRPLIRMRQAARQLAEGRLEVRVAQSAAQARRSESDEFQGLVLDFNYMAERLESMVDAQKLLVRDISHELRSPLARLSVALELARDEEGADLEQHLARIEREASRLNQLIGQLLTLSALEARDSRASFAPVSLEAICAALLPDAVYEARQRACTVELAADGPCVIEGNAELLRRAIENVARNAIRYTDAGTLVTIELAPVVRNGGRYAALTVSDHGPGLPEAELSKIFRPFYRVDRARSADTGGVGVGLAITDRAVRLHGGSVAASNRAGGGMVVEMLFPVTIVDEPQAEAAYVATAPAEAR